MKSTKQRFCSLALKHKQCADELTQMRMKEVKETVAQFVKYERNQIKYLTIKKGCGIMDYEVWLYGDNYNPHSTK